MSIKIVRVSNVAKLAINTHSLPFTVATPYLDEPWYWVKVVYSSEVKGSTVDSIHRYSRLITLINTGFRN